jgi:hypothetical protein
VSIAIPEVLADPIREDAYCVQVGRRRDYVSLDKKLVRGGAHPKGIEICDLFGPRGELICVKRAARSSVLSHLFFQAVVAAEDLADGDQARKKNAIHYVSEALDQAGHTEVAVQWLTAALETALERRNAVASRRGDRVYEQAAVIGFALAQVRHRLRRELDLPHDDHDLLADRLRKAADEINAREDNEYEGTAVLYWPLDQFNALLLRWPRLADVYGATWHDHRTRLEQGLVALSESGEARLAVFAGSVDDLTAYVGRHGGDVADPDVRQGYVEHRELTHSTRRLWPPQRNEVCWGGSGVKYKRCCLPRSRT